jgi:hypothetical protein
VSTSGAGIRVPPRTVRRSPFPLTAFQTWLGRLLAGNRSEDSHLAGGAVLLSSPNTLRYSHDRDFFHDSEERVATAFAADRATLVEAGCSVEEEISQPGYVRAIVRRLKCSWLQALDEAEDFVRSRPPQEAGCLYFDPQTRRFLQPGPDGETVPHFGRPGDVLPRLLDGK